jgi:ChpA-C
MHGRIHVIKKFAAAGVVAAAASGALLLGSPAYADNDTSGAGGVLSGNQAVIPISIPVNACGNSLAVLGLAGSGCRGGASVGHGHGHRYPIF